MDRRDFLKAAGAGAAALGAVACAPGVGKQSNSRSADKQISGKVPEHLPGVGLLGYGAMRWPTRKAEDGREEIIQEEVNKLVDKALEHGVNYFDTSPVYLGGKSEEATAIALSRHPRDKWLLATKLSNFADWTYDNSVEMYRKSLEIFKTDHIDYYLLHSLSGGEAFETRFGSTGIMDFLLKERTAGHIRNLGFSFHGSTEGFDEMMALHDKYHWDFVQIQMNYLDWTHASGRNADAEYLYRELDRRGIPIVIMEPLRGGYLADMPAALADQLKAREPAGSLASWAFRFVGSFPRVAVVLSGMTYMEHLLDNLKTYTDFKPLSEEDFALLENVAEQLDSYPLIKCTGCQYCMPCPYGIDIPGIFAFYNGNINAGTYVSGHEQKHYQRDRRRYLLRYNKAVESVRQADHCISCGKCVSHCPQKIAIPRELRRIDQYIEKLKQDLL